jgi:hypothetical protein
MMPSLAGRALRVSSSTKHVFAVALHRASRTGRQKIEAVDLLGAVFEQTQGASDATTNGPRRARIDPKVRKAIEAAAREAHRRGHAVLTPAHLLKTIARVDRRVFASMARGAAKELLAALEESLNEMDALPHNADAQVRVSTDVERAIRRAARAAAGRRITSSEMTHALMAAFRPQSSMREITREDSNLASTFVARDDLSWLSGPIVQMFGLLCATTVMLARGGPNVAVCWSFALAAAVILVTIRVARGMTKEFAPNVVRTADRRRP